MTEGEFRELWKSQEDSAARLRWARTYWQMRAGSVEGSAKHAAESLGMKDGTYRAYERPPGSSRHTELGHQEAIRFGRKFQVSWSWLLLGEGTPFDDQLPPAQERVLRAMERADPDQQDALANLVEAFIQRKTG